MPTRILACKPAGAERRGGPSERVFDTAADILTEARMEGKDLDVRKATDKNRLFVRLILEGKQTVVAHKLAGYKGDPHAAYELRGKLRALLAHEAEARGISLDGLKADAAALNVLPVAATSVSVREKLAIMAETRKIVELSGGGAKNAVINALVIERGPVVDAERVNEPEPEAHADNGERGGVGEVGQAPSEQGVPTPGEDPD